MAWTIVWYAGKKWLDSRCINMKHRENARAAEDSEIGGGGGVWCKIEWEELTTTSILSHGADSILIL